MSNVLILLSVIVAVYIGIKIAGKAIMVIVFLGLVATALYFLAPLAGSL